MVVREKHNSSEEPTARVARIIIFDTLNSQNDDADMLVQTIAMLKGEEGEGLTQSVMSQYLGSGEGGSYDSRVLKIPVLNITAGGLRDEMTRLLEQYAVLPESSKPDFMQNLQNQG